MKQTTFVSRYERDWELLEGWLESRRTQRKASRDQARSFPAGEFPQRYRRVCQQLALARKRGYSPALVRRLQDLVQAGHQHLYRPPPLRWQMPFEFIASGFPRLIRRHFRFVLLSGVLFFLAFIAAGLTTHARPGLIYSVYGARQVAHYERMYAPAQQSARGMEADLRMFGHYIMNNVSIAFRTLASGLFFGIGSLLVLVMNGVMLGSVGGFLTAIGSGSTFWSFVAGHSAPELLAIVISGAAGLRLGFALMAPGRQTRTQALRAAARDGALMALGAFVMLTLAAFIEAFWSSSVWVPDVAKYVFGCVLWLAIVAWLSLGGRRAV